MHVELVSKSQNTWKASFGMPSFGSIQYVPVIKSFLVTWTWHLSKIDNWIWYYPNVQGQFAKLFTAQSANSLNTSGGVFLWYHFTDLRSAYKQIEIYYYCKTIISKDQEAFWYVICVRALFTWPRRTCTTHTKDHRLFILFLILIAHKSKM